MNNFGHRIADIGHRLRLALVALAMPAALVAQSKSDTTVKITWGGFVDGYYAWDFGEPPTFDRSFFGGTPFTTQPTRHNEFNVNLAFVEGKLESERIRGRLALQVGTSVQSNYSGEPAIGLFSGPVLSDHIQEAIVGVKLADNFWVDGGIMFSHIGLESWISRDNPTYTRSLVAEYSPYYQSGFKFTYTRKKLTAQLDVVNGWQNISENNTGKGAGIRLDYAVTPSATISYYNLFSDEAVNVPRIFNGIGVKAVTAKWILLGQFDVGTQTDSGSWYGFTAIGRYQMTQKAAVALRLEGFNDEDQAIIITGAGNGPFDGVGASVGLDYSPIPRVVWRSELRGFLNDTDIFPNGISGGPKDSGGFIVSSLAVTF